MKTLAKSPWLEFTHDCNGYYFQAHSCLSRGCQRWAQPHKCLWHNFCPVHSSGPVPPTSINSASMSSLLLQLPAAPASCWRKPWWPRNSSALCPCHDFDCCPVFGLAQAQELTVLWTVLGQSLSWRGNVGLHLLSQIRFNESKGCVIKGSSQEVGLKLFWWLFKRHWPRHSSKKKKKIEHIKKKSKIWFKSYKGKSIRFEAGGIEKQKEERFKWE